MGESRCASCRQRVWKLFRLNCQGSWWWCCISRRLEAVGWRQSGRWPRGWFVWKKLNTKIGEEISRVITELGRTVGGYLMEGEEPEQRRRLREVWSTLEYRKRHSQEVHKWDQRGLSNWGWELFQQVPTVDLWAPKWPSSLLVSIKFCAQFKNFFLDGIEKQYTLTSS